MWVWLVCTCVTFPGQGRFRSVQEDSLVIQPCLLHTVVSNRHLALFFGWALDWWVGRLVVLKKVTATSSPLPTLQAISCNILK